MRRLLAMAMLLLVALLSLGYRLVDLQVLRHEELSAKAEGNTLRAFVRQPLRGDVRDCRGNPIAVSVPAKAVCADPTIIGPWSAHVARVVAPLLGVNEAELARLMTPKIIRYTTNNVPVYDKYVVLKRRVPLETWQLIRTNMARMQFGLDESKLSSKDRSQLRYIRTRALHTEDDQIRRYPGGSQAAHVVGFVSMGDTIEGLSGLERAFDEQLSGVRGWLCTETDSRGREMLTCRAQDVEARNGLNVVSTIDLGLQHILEAEMAEGVQKHSPISISGVIVRPATGEILAMATLPSFDPNKPAATPVDHQRNRLITDIAEPGSTFKIVVVSSALSEHEARLTDTYFCENGRFSFAGRVLHDHESYGNLTVQGIITKSSNIGTAKLGIKLGPERLYDYVRRFGFGTRTGLTLPGEVGGIVHPVKNWSKVSIAQIPMGHGLACTPLQTIMAMCAIANQGCLMRPWLVKRLEDQNGRVVMEYSPQRVRQVITSEAARDMVKALKTVVSPEGTAAKAKLEHFTAAGKTGTANKVEGGRYVAGKYFSSFIGFFPADAPELCIAVVIDEPKNGHYGGQTAAPIFAAIGERAANYLNLRPEIMPEPALAAGAAAKKAQVRR